MKVNELPSLDLLNYLFFLDKKTGILTRKVKISGSKNVGDLVGSLHKSGYLVLKINGVKYLLHRVVYKMFYEKEPPPILDHKDRNRLNNSPKNLREATYSQNNQNTKKNRRNTSGVRGVSWQEKSKKWRVKISKNGKDFRIGLYESKEEAIKAAKNGYSILHAEFNGVTN